MSALLTTLLLVMAPSQGELPVPIDDKFSDGRPGQVAESSWWTRLEDGNLAALIDEGLESNQDIQAAAQRLVAAQALAEQSRGTLLPTLDLNANLSVGPLRGITFQFGGMSNPNAPSLFWRGSATLDARYAVDTLWRQRLLYEAARLSETATAHERDQVGMVVALQIGEAYFDVVAAAERLRHIEEQIKINENLLELTKLRFERSEASGLDVLQQKQRSAGTLSQLPAARSQLRIQKRRLLLLVGRSPSGGTPEHRSALPDLNRMPATGAPMDLLDNRPDLRAAQFRLTAATRRKTNASRVHLPSLALTGQAGVQYNRTTEWNAQENWSAGVGFNLPLFRGGRDVATVKQAIADERTARANYAQSILRAVSEVEAALIRTDEQSKQLEAIVAQHEAAKLAFEESRARYVAGLSSYLSVLNALNGLFGAELTIVNAKRALVSAHIQLEQALGGAWTHGLLMKNTETK